MRSMLVLAVLGPAVAAAENDQALSIGAGFASFSAPGVPTMMDMTPDAVSPDGGGGVFVSYERMIGSDLGLRVDGAAHVFGGGNTDKQSTVSYAFLGDAGLVFRFDVLHFVPYAFAGLGAVHTSGGPIDNGLDYVVQIGGGVDWLRSRERSYGVELRLASFAGEITVATIGIRGTHRWGFF